MDYQEKNIKCHVENEDKVFVRIVLSFNCINYKHDSGERHFGTPALGTPILHSSWYREPSDRGLKLARYLYLVQRSYVSTSLQVFIASCFVKQRIHLHGVVLN
jgi:hypothetical protein